MFTTSGSSLHQGVHYIREFTTSGSSLHQGVHYIRVCLRTIEGIDVLSKVYVCYIREFIASRVHYREVQLYMFLSTCPCTTSRCTPFFCLCFTCHRSCAWIWPHIDLDKQPNSLIHSFFCKTNCGGLKRVHCTCFCSCNRCVCISGLLVSCCPGQQPDTDGVEHGSFVPH